MNCLSLRDAAPFYEFHVLSVGSEGLSAIQTQMLKDLAPAYKRVFVWVDDPAKGQKVQMAMMPGPEQINLIPSPNIDGKKYDANQCAQEGILEELLSLHLGQSES
jgi:hypothetical protein